MQKEPRVGLKLEPVDHDWLKEEAAKLSLDIATFLRLMVRQTRLQAEHLASGTLAVPFIGISNSIAASPAPKPRYMHESRQTEEYAAPQPRMRVVPQLQPEDTAGIDPELAGVLTRERLELDLEAIVDSAAELAQSPFNEPGPDLHPTETVRLVGPRRQRSATQHRV